MSDEAAGCGGGSAVRVGPHSYRFRVGDPGDIRKQLAPSARRRSSTIRGTVSAIEWSRSVGPSLFEAIESSGFGIKSRHNCPVGLDSSPDRVREF